MVSDIFQETLDANQTISDTQLRYLLCMRALEVNYKKLTRPSMPYCWEPIVDGFLDGDRGEERSIFTLLHR